MEVKKLSPKIINSAVKILNNGGVIVCPTDTVYGLICDAGNKKAIEKIYKIKKRPKSKPLAVFVRGFKMAKELAEINEKQFKILKNKWPGKFTFVLQRKNGLKLYDGAKDTIALRIPKYKFLNDLLKKINRPLAQTSVNISGKPALTKISDIINQFGKHDVFLMNIGDLPKSKSSTIIDLTAGVKVLRS